MTEAEFEDRPTGNGVALPLGVFAEPRKFDHKNGEGVRDSQSCGNCRFYQERPSYGVCRRFPPQEKPSGIGVYPGEELPYEFARVRSSMYCGEWKLESGE